MSKPSIVVGDKTDHGGAFMTGSPVSPVTGAGGKGIARAGDKVSCPKHGHGATTTIAPGDPPCIIDGQPAARDADKTACGVTLIASQAISFD